MLNWTIDCRHGVAGRATARGRPANIGVRPSAIAPQTNRYGRAQISAGRGGEYRQIYLSEASGPAAVKIVRVLTAGKAPEAATTDGSPARSRTELN